MLVRSGQENEMMIEALKPKCIVDYSSYIWDDLRKLLIYTLARCKNILILNHQEWRGRNQMMNFFLLHFVMFHYPSKESTKQGCVLKRYDLWIVLFVGGGHGKVFFCFLHDKQSEEFTDLLVSNHFKDLKNVVSNYVLLLLLIK